MVQSVYTVSLCYGIIASLERYLEIKDDKVKWKPLFDALWSFPYYKGRIDDYAYKVIECAPESILDEREDFTNLGSDSEYSVLQVVF